MIIPFYDCDNLLIYIFRVFIIHLFLRLHLQECRIFLLFSLIGDILKIMGWVLGYLLLAKAMTRIYIVMEVVNFLLLIVISYFLVKWYGSIGATMAFAIVYLIYFLVLCIIFRNSLKNEENSQ